MENETGTRPNGGCARAQLDVLYRDGDLLAVNKPSGLLVHRGIGCGPLVLTDLVRPLTCGGKAHPAHRLDRSASGVMLFALNEDIARELQKMFAHGEIGKSYLALVRGRTPEQGIIDRPLNKKEGGPRLPSLTEFRCLHTVEIEPREVSLVLAFPRTGRLHQVRRHLRHISHPLIGDANHGQPALNRGFRERYGLARLALHALALTLAHPRTGAKLHITAPLPDDLRLPFLSMGFPEEAWAGLCDAPVWLGNPV
ncbi:MAG: pseudouridylate synthase [Deltaproteobacteria bacterium]|nr:pseudouridylate synthase [Deltaproteobacteria bacterium]